MDINAATQTMIDNVPAKTGRTLDEWFAIVGAAGLEKHGQILSHLKSEYGVSLRRRKQFALIEAASAERIQLGLNLRGATATDRLRVAGGMCTHRVDITSSEQIDGELIGWLREAYEQA